MSEEGEETLEEFCRRTAVEGIKHCTRRIKNNDGEISDIFATAIAEACLKGALFALENKDKIERVDL